MARKKRTPGYLLHKQSGQARVVLDGKDHLLGPYGSPESRELYTQLIALWQQNNGGEVKRQTVTIGHLIVGYLRYSMAYYQKDGQETSEVGAIRSAMRILKARFASLPAVEFGPKKLIKVREDMIAAGWTRKSINRQVGRVVQMLRWAKSEELISAEVCDSCAGLKGLRKGRSEAKEAPRVLPASDEQILSVESFLPPTICAMVWTQLLTGMRPGEIRNLKLCQLSMDGDVWEYIPASHKTEHHEKDRVIFIGPRAQDVMQPFITADRDRYVFESRPGQSYTKDAYNRAIRRACDKAGVEPWSPNQLRHYAGTEIRKQHGLEATRTVLGHSTAVTTEIYAEQDRETAKAIMRRIG